MTTAIVKPSLVPVKSYNKFNQEKISKKMILEVRAKIFVKNVQSPVAILK